MKNILFIHSDASKELAGLLYKSRKDVKVHAVGDGAKALEMLAEGIKVDAIIADADIEGEVDVFKLALSARDTAADALMVALSDAPAFDMQPAAGVVGWCKRPADPAQLEADLFGLLKPKARAERTLDKLELIDIVSLGCAARRTVVLHLRHLDRKGRIGMAGGHIVHAVFDGNVGNDALFDLIALRQGNMYVRHGARPKKKTVAGKWQDLIIQAAQSLDERRTKHDEFEAKAKAGDEISESDVNELFGPNWSETESMSEIAGGGSFFDEDDLAEIGDLNEIGAPEAPTGPGADPAAQTSVRERPAAVPLPSPARQQPTMRPTVTEAANPEALIERFCDEIPEFVATDIVNRPDGISLIGASAAPEYDSQSACAYYSDFVNSCLRAVGGYGLGGDLREIHVSTQNAYILVRTIADSPYIHLLLMHRSGNLGIAKVVMRQYEPLFAQALPAWK